MNEKALKVIEAAKSQLGNPYVFGMWGRECTPSVRRQYAGYNPSHKRAIFKACPVLSGKQPSCDGCKWQGKLAFDCRGFTYWCLSQVGITIKGGGATSQYNTAANWLQRGEVGDMPDVVCCVFQRRNGKMQHTGLHIGGGKIIHCSAGVQWGDTSDKVWTHYAIPAGLYTAEEIAAAGKAAHLAGALAANTVLPVIGLPISSSTLDGLDALLSTVQMPSGMPVATVAIDGARNAALLAAQMLSLCDDALREKLRALRERNTQAVIEKDRKLQDEIDKILEA